MRWLDRINDDSQAARLDLFMQQYGDPGAREAALHRSASDTMAFFSCLAAARKRWQQARSGRKAGNLLPYLNG
jgi:hypothetical protein